MSIASIEVSEDAERISPHQLPDEGQRQRRVSVVDVLALDANQRELAFLPQINGVIAVF